MKYLRLHKLLCAFIVTFLVASDILFFFIYYVASVVWNFRIPKGLWMKLHHTDFSDEASLYPVEHNPKETWLNLYHEFFPLRKGN